MFPARQGGYVAYLRRLYYGYQSTYSRSILITAEKGLKLPLLEHVSNLTHEIAHSFQSGADYLEIGRYPKGSLLSQLYVYYQDYYPEFWNHMEKDLGWSYRYDDNFYVQQKDYFKDDEWNDQLRLSGPGMANAAYINLIRDII